MRLKRGFIHIPLLAVIAVVLIVFGLSYISNSKKAQRESEKQQEENSPLIYQSTYWGFRVKYPRGFEASENPDGVSIANYKTNKSHYNQQKGELLVKIVVTDRPLLRIKESSEKSVEKFTDVLTDEGYVEVVKVQDSYPARGLYTYLDARIVRNGFTYSFIAEQSDSALIEVFFDIVKSAEYFPRDEFLSRTDTPRPGMKSYENTRWGFAFDYPETWEFTDFKTGRAFLSTNKQYIYININLHNSYNLSGNFIEDVKWPVVSWCFSDGHTTSTGCPLEKLEYEPFISSKDAKGYLFTRTRVAASASDNSIFWEGKDYVVAYPLPIQEYFAIVFEPSFTTDDYDYKEEILTVADTFQLLQLKPH